MILRRIFTLIRQEFRRLFTFGMVGLSSLGLLLGGYKLFSLVLWRGGPPTFQYTIIAVLVAWFNYEANRYFTFNRSNRTSASVWRFMTVGGVASVINSVLFWFGHEVLSIPDTFVILGNSAIIALFTFTSHRLFTFRVSRFARDT